MCGLFISSADRGFTPWDIQARAQSKEILLHNISKCSRGSHHQKSSQRSYRLKSSGPQSPSTVKIRVLDRLYQSEGILQLKTSEDFRIWFNKLKWTPWVHSQVHSCLRCQIRKSQESGIFPGREIHLILKDKTDIFGQKVGFTFLSCN